MVSDLNSVEFPLSINREEYLLYYTGQIKWVIARSTCGRRIQFPANLLATHVTHSGINGQFILSYQSNGKAVSLKKKK